MAYSRETSKALLATVLPLYVLFIASAVQSSVRELRPSDHGLAYQGPPPAGAKPPPGMLSFFGASSPSAPSPKVSLPNALNSSDAASSCWRDVGGGCGGRGGRDRLRRVLLVASLACGATGVVLLVASALVFVLKFRKERSESAPPPCPPALPRLQPQPSIDDYKGRSID